VTRRKNYVSYLSICDKIIGIKFERRIFFFWGGGLLIGIEDVFWDDMCNRHKHCIVGTCMGVLTQRTRVNNRDLKVNVYNQVICPRTSGSHSGGYERFYLFIYNAVQTVEVD
jgi:hypothetical protein